MTVTDRSFAPCQIYSRRGGGEGVLRTHIELLRVVRAFLSFFFETAFFQVRVGPIDLPLPCPQLNVSRRERKRMERAHSLTRLSQIGSSKVPDGKVVKDGSNKRERFHQGFIAQEVKQTIDSMGVDFGGYQDHSIAGGQDVKSLGYQEFIAPLVKAVQELSARVVVLENQVNS